MKIFITNIIENENLNLFYGIGINIAIQENFWMMLGKEFWIEQN